MGKYTRSKRSRSRSRYPLRLKKRGLSKSPVMPSLEALRKKQRAFVNEWSELDVDFA